MRGLKGNSVYSVENFIQVKQNGEGVRTTPPLIPAASPFVLEKGRVYRMIGTADLNFYLSKEDTPAAATASDILVPANTVATIDTVIFDKLVFIGGGTLQLTELTAV